MYRYPRHVLREADDLTVFLEGELIAERLPTTLREGDAAFVTARLWTGEHEWDGSK